MSIYSRLAFLKKMSLLNIDNYFSITDILVTEERIQSEIHQSLPNLGFLYVSSKESDLRKGTKLDLPLWLADQLSKNRGLMVTCEIPKIYKDSYKEILQADACAVELFKWNQYYYELGLQLPITSNIEALKLSEFLLEVFKARFRIIVDWEQNPLAIQSQRGQLTVLEKNLLCQGNKARMHLLNWLNSGVKHIESSTVLLNIKRSKSYDVKKTS